MMFYQFRYNIGRFLTFLLLPRNIYRRVYDMHATEFKENTIFHFLPNKFQPIKLPISHITGWQCDSTECKDDFIINIRDSSSHRFVAPKGELSDLKYLLKEKLPGLEVME